IQFAYRTITYINMAALAGTLLLVFGARPAESREPAVVLPLLNGKTACALVCIAAIGLGIKLYHAQRIVKTVQPIAFAGQRTDYELLTLPDTFYGPLAYSTPGLVPGRLMDDYQHAHRLHLTPQTGSHFGDLAPTVVPQPLTGWTSTNVQVAPWNRILIDQRDETMQAAGGENTYMFLDMKPCVLSYSYVPDGLWLILHRISFPLLGLWIFATTGITGFAALSHCRRGDAERERLCRKWRAACRTAFPRAAPLGCVALPSPPAVRRSAGSISHSSPCPLRLRGRA
ncbi:MAG: hypothetical protein ACRD3W_26520, partial [Terriglobales bacterium]